MRDLDCDWMIEANQKSHHTDEYDNDLLVMRRGQTFTLKMSLKRKMNREFDECCLELTTGPNPQLLNNTKIRIPLVDSLDVKQWGMKITDESTVEKKLDAPAAEGEAAAEGAEAEKEKVPETLFLTTLEVNIPASAVIGKYKAFIEFKSKLQDGTVSKVRDDEPEFYILFNPWCKDDTVYMENDEERAEYCTEDTGIIYRGSTRRISGKQWNFGQFEPKILDCILSLLDKDKRMASKPNKWLERRSDPVWVSRVIPYMINEQVLVGNWSGDYSGGTSPVKWNGSVKILTEHYDTNKPVQFGQCWVFSGVVTTALRALGIPTRSITNFASAHDTECSMTIDKYVDQEGDEIELSGDSVWNFHVWNEAWMKRTDLPAGYDGWQVIDATPQEISLGLYQTGPAPLAAIKNGEVYLGFETGFVFAEVNSDRITWMVKQDRNDGNYIVERMGRHYKRSVGKYISTKAVGTDLRHDVTNDYKFKEGTAEERESFAKAYSFGKAPDSHKGFLMHEEEGNGVTIDIETPDEIMIGSDIKATVKIQNDTTDNVHLNIAAVLYSTNYMGDRSRFVKRVRLTDVPLEGSAAVSKDFTVAFSEYLSKLTENQSLRLTVAVKVVETSKTFSDEKDFEIETPESSVIEVKGDMKIGEVTKVSVKFTNPLPVKMSGVEMTLEGSGLSYPVTKPMPTLEAGESTDMTFDVTPTRSGLRTIIVDVDSKQLKDMKTSKKFRIVRD